MKVSNEEVPQPHNHVTIQIEEGTRIRCTMEDGRAVEVEFDRSRRPKDSTVLVWRPGITRVLFMVSRRGDWWSWRREVRHWMECHWPAFAERTWARSRAASVVELSPARQVQQRAVELLVAMGAANHSLQRRSEVRPATEAMADAAAVLLEVSVQARDLRALAGRSDEEGNVRVIYTRV